ncbi:MAG: hypothetical protein KY455_10430 [Euryarchaeota archaeon]|nr:hypothetical protein [Euryarchaeota archaeon]
MTGMTTRKSVAAGILAVTFVGAAVLVGTSGDASLDAGDSPLHQHADEAALEVPYEYSGCDLMTTAIRVDMEAARQVVAPGFEPLDGGHMFNANPQLVETGTAMLGISALECAHIAVVGGPGSFAFAWIDIEEPSVGNGSSPSPHDGYDLIDVVESPAHAGFLEQARLPVVEGAVSVRLDSTSPVATGEIRIEGPDGTIAEIAAVGTGDLSAAITFANWHQTDEGVGLMYLKSPSRVHAYLAKAVTCTVAEGSLLASLIGGTDCTAANGQGVIATGVASDGWLKFWPGVAAE